MATTKKKTTTGTKSTAAKPKAAPAPKPVVATPAPVVQFAVPAAEHPDPAPLTAEEKIEQTLEHMNRILREEKRVILRTPHDPNGEAKLYERNLGGKLFVLKSDTLYSVPVTIAKAIKKQIRIQEVSDMTMEEFTTKKGKFLG